MFVHGRSEEGEFITEDVFACCFLASEWAPVLAVCTTVGKRRKGTCSDGPEARPVHRTFDFDPHFVYNPVRDRTYFTLPTGPSRAYA